MDIEAILEMYEDDYNPSSKVPGPRNMYNQGQLVQPSDDGSRPGYNGRNKGIGKGSPGVPKNYETTRDQLYTEETKAKKAKTNKLKFQAEPIGERLQWIANNGKNYNNTKDFITAYEKHFKHKIGSKTDVLFNTPGKKPLTQVDNLMNTGRAQQDLFTLTFKDGKAFNQNELFKASIIQNNPEIKKEFKTLFKDIHKNVSVYSELGPEGIVERLNKGKLLTEFDFIKSGVGSGITRNSLLNAAGINSEHLTSYQNVRKPLMALSQIIQNLKNPSFAKDFKISPTTATKIRGQLENFFKGERGLQADIKKINNQLGDVKFNNIFGGVNFEHTLAKQFGKDYKYLPRNYLLKGQFTTKAFNMMKKDAFDLPLINLMKQYEQGKIPAERVQAFIDDFNAKTNNYADFKFDVDKGKLGYTSDSVTYDLSRYNNPNVARQELIDNIKLTQSDTFQQGMKKTLPNSKDQLKLFKSGEATNILKKLINEIGPCGAGKKKAMGGRIGFKTAGDVCMTGGRQTIAEFLKNGFKNANGEQKEIFKKILSLGGGAIKGVGSMLDPRELFKIKNLVGPAAWAAMGAFETGAITYDVVNNNIPLNEALGSNWITKFAMPYTLKEAQIKNLEDSGASLSPAAKEYMAQTKLMSQFEREFKALEGMKMGVFGTENPKELIQDQEKKLENIVRDVVKLQASPVAGGAGQLDFDKAFGEMAEKRGAGYYDPENEDANEYGYVDVGDSIFGFKQGTPLTYKYRKDRGKDQGRNLSETERKAEKLFPFETGTLRADYTPFNYKSFNYTPQELPADMVKQYEKDYNLPPRTSLNQFNFKGSDNNVLQDLTNEYNLSQKAKQASRYPGYDGTQSPYSEGGIASLNVNKK